MTFHETLKCLDALRKDCFGGSILLMPLTFIEGIYRIIENKPAMIVEMDIFRNLFKEQFKQMTESQLREEI
jgi:hypothetical protein